jgi:excisionase family DNA binding protein
MKPDEERPTMSIPEAAKVLGIGVNGAYEAAKRGEIPTITIGKRILVLREPLRRLLGGGSPSEAT